MRARIPLRLHTTSSLLLPTSPVDPELFWVRAIHVANERIVFPDRFGITVGIYIPSIFDLPQTAVATRFDTPCGLWFIFGFTHAFQRSQPHKLVTYTHALRGLRLGLGTC